MWSSNHNPTIDGLKFKPRHKCAQVLPGHCKLPFKKGNSPQVGILWARLELISGSKKEGSPSFQMDRICHQNMTFGVKATTPGCLTVQHQDAVKSRRSTVLHQNDEPMAHGEELVEALLWIST